MKNTNEWATKEHVVDESRRVLFPGKEKIKIAEILDLHPRNAQFAVSLVYEFLPEDIKNELTKELLDMMQLNINAWGYVFYNNNVRLFNDLHYHWLCYRIRVYVEEIENEQEAQG
jgi:hypothetical protein